MTFLSARMGFVKFYRSALAAKRLRVDFSHSLTNAMAEVPGRLVGNIERALQCIGSFTLCQLDNNAFVDVVGAAD